MLSDFFKMDAKCSIPLRIEFKLTETQFNGNITSLKPKKCQSCSFKAISDLLHLRHCVLSGPQCKWFNCEDCGQIFESAQELQRHRRTNQLCLLTELSHEVANLHTDIAANHSTVAVESREWFNSTSTHAKLPLECQFCGYRTEHRLGLVNHLRIRHNASPSDKHRTEFGEFKCLECNYTHKTMHGLRAHFTSRHLTDEEKLQLWLKCPACKFRCSRQYAMQAHIITKHVQKTDLGWLQCTFCPYKNRAKSDLTRHITAHHNETTPQVNCNICNSRVKQSYLKVHLTKMHKIKFKTFKCHFCEKSFKWRMSLLGHIRRKHIVVDDKQWYKCSYCEHKTLQSQELKKHLNAQHRSVELPECTICTYKPTTLPDLKRHLRTHTQPNSNRAKKETVSCPSCSLKFVNASNLKMHVLRKHTRDEDIAWFPCTLCDYKSKIKGDLRIHMRGKHRDPTPKHSTGTKLSTTKKLLSCTFCDYKSENPSNVKMHIVRKHTKDEDILWYPCAQCPFRSKTKSYLEQHMKKKHDVTFSCTFCAYKSKSDHYVTEHMKQKHKARVNKVNCTSCTSVH